MILKNSFIYTHFAGFFFLLSGAMVITPAQPLPVPSRAQVNLGTVDAQKVGTVTSAFQVHNQGTEPLIVEGVSMSGPDVELFDVFHLNATPVTISVGGQWTFYLSLDAQKNGPIRATVEFDFAGTPTLSVPVLAEGAPYVPWEESILLTGPNLWEVNAETGDRRLLAAHEQPFYGARAYSSANFLSRRVALYTTRWSGAHMSGVDLAIRNLADLSFSPLFAGWAYSGPLIDTLPTSSTARVVLGFPGWLESMNPETGDKTVISAMDIYGQTPVGTGPDFSMITQMSILSPHAILLLDYNGGLITVDWDTGDRQTFMTYQELLDSPLEGQPLHFDSHASADGFLYALKENEPVILRLSMSDRQFSTVSGGGRGDGPALRNPRALCLGAAGEEVFVYDAGYPAILRVDIATGDRGVVSGMKDAPRGGGADLYVEIYGVSLATNAGLRANSGASWLAR